MVNMAPTNCRKLRGPACSDGMSHKVQAVSVVTTAGFACAVHPLTFPHADRAEDDDAA